VKRLEVARGRASPSKHKVLSSNPNTVTKNTKKYWYFKSWSLSTFTYSLYKMILFEHYFIIILWVLNSGICTCQACTLSLEPHPQSFFALVISWIGSCIYAQVGLDQVFLFMLPTKVGWQAHTTAPRFIDGVGGVMNFFAWTDLESWSSWSLPGNEATRIVSMSHHACFEHHLKWRCNLLYVQIDECVCVWGGTRAYPCISRTQDIFIILENYFLPLPSQYLWITCQFQAYHYRLDLLFLNFIKTKS
jgi:hypothetical protein